MELRTRLLRRLERLVALVDARDSDGWGGSDSGRSGNGQTAPDSGGVPIGAPSQQG